MDNQESLEKLAQEHIDSLFQKVKDAKACDLYLCAGTHPFLRHGDRLRQLNEYPVVSEQVLVDIFSPVLSDAEQQTWLHQGGDVEKTYRDGDGFHIRINCHNNVQGKGVTCRILHKVPTLAELSPQGAETLRKLANSPQGLIIIAGKADSGKTTTLAAFIDHVNHHHCRTVLTIEKPIQFFHDSKSSLVLQRQVGLHCPDYTVAIRSGLRSDIDVIMVDQIHTNDHQTLHEVLVAAESSLVLTSLHSFGGAGWTLQKLVGSAPPDLRDLLLNRFSRVIRGIIWQDLVPVNDALERKPIMEIMFNTPRIAKLIRQQDFAAIGAEIEKTDGMITMEQSVSPWKDRLVRTNKVIKILDIIDTIGTFGSMILL
jgi:twitching motility protein PilT